MLGECDYQTTQKHYVIKTCDNIKRDICLRSHRVITCPYWPFSKLLSRTECHKQNVRAVDWMVCSIALCINITCTWWRRALRRKKAVSIDIFPIINMQAHFNVNSNVNCSAIHINTTWVKLKGNLLKALFTIGNFLWHMSFSTLVYLSTKQQIGFSKFIMGNWIANILNGPSHILYDTNCNYGIAIAFTQFNLHLSFPEE